MLASEEGLLPEPPGGVMSGWRAPFQAPGFRPYAVAYAGSTFAWTLSAVVFAWVTLIVTTDPLAVGAIFAVRFLALLLFGIPAGVLADRVDRRRMLVAVSLGGACVGALLAVTAWVGGGTLPLWVLLGGSFLMGILDAGRISAATTYAFDLVGPLLATSGIAVANLLAQAMGILGNLVGGVLLGGFGMVVALSVMTVSSLFSAVVLGLSRGHTRRTVERPRVAPAGLRTSLTLLRRNRLLMLLFLTVVMVEVLGFSSMTLVPVFARDVFGAGPDAYGMMNAVRGLGGVIGLIVVIRLGLRVTRGTALMVFDGLFGAALVVFALSPGFLVALLPLLVAGAAAAGADSLSQSLMQRATTDAERGAAMGIWAFAIGFGPLGHLVAGAAAGRFGAVPTQVVFGLCLVGMSVLLVLQPLIRSLGRVDPVVVPGPDAVGTGTPTII